MADAFVYPGSVLDQVDTLLATLGTFWSRTYSGVDQVAAFAQGRAQLAAQSHQDLLELVASVSRYEVPIWHKDNWYYLALRQSELNTVRTSPQRYDGTLSYDGTRQFDAPQQQPLYTYPLPANLRDVSLIMNRLTSPSLVWTRELDFQLDFENDALVFRQDPFASELVATHPVYEDGEIVDHEAALWLFRGDFDYQHAYQQFGYILGLKLQSSRGYRELLNAIFDGIVGGTAKAQIEQAFQAITGVPLVQELTETVEVANYDARGLLIVTDKHAYRFPVDATPVVAVGDEVHAGDPLVDTVEILEFNRGEVPARLPALALGRGLASACFYGDLIFENKDVPLEVNTEHSSGYTYVKFGLGGFPLDVTAFFDEIHSRGIVLAEQPQDECNPVRTGTLAHLLDKRTNRTGEPTAANLPSTINPLEFLITNVLSCNAFAVRVKVSGMGASALGLYNARHLQRLIPPHTVMLLIQELAATQDRVAELVSDSLGQYQGVEPLSDTVPQNLVREKPLGIRLISGTCQ